MDELDEIFVGFGVPALLFLTIGGVVVAWMIFRYLERARLHDTLRVLAEKDGDAQRQLLAALNQQNEPSAQRDLRRGIGGVAIALGCVGLAVMIGIEDGEVIWPLVGVGFFPLAFGLGHLLLWRLNRSKQPG